MPLQLLLRLCVGALSYMSVSWCQRRPAGGLDEVRGVAPPPPGDSGSTWRLAHSPVCLRVTNTTTQVSSLATAWYYRGGRFWFCFCWVVFERFVASFDLILRPFFYLFSMRLLIIFISFSILVLTVLVLVLWLISCLGSWLELFTRVLDFFGPVLHLVFVHFYVRLFFVVSFMIMAVVWLVCEWSLCSWSVFWVVLSLF